MRVLGIDCGSEYTGYGVVDGDGQQLEVVASGVIHAPSQLPLSERLLLIGDGLARLLEAFTPDVAAIESLFFAVNAKSALKLGHVRGVAMLEAARAGIPVTEYSPMEVKSSVVGYGRAEKHQVQQMVRSILRMEQAPDSEDEADALAIAICHINISATEQRMAKASGRTH